MMCGCIINPFRIWTDLVRGGDARSARSNRCLFDLTFQNTTTTMRQIRSSSFDDDILILTASMRSVVVTLNRRWEYRIGKQQDRQSGVESYHVWMYKSQTLHLSIDHRKTTDFVGVVFGGLIEVIRLLWTHRVEFDLCLRQESMFSRLLSRSLSFPFNQQLSEK